MRAEHDPVRVKLLDNKPVQFATRRAPPLPPPVVPTLSTSPHVCSLFGEHTFTVFLDWKLDGIPSICALVKKEQGRNIGLEIRDFARKGRRIGPTSDRMVGDEEDPNDPIIDEDLFVRLENSGDRFCQSYVLGTEPKRNGLVSSDTWSLVSGKDYELGLRTSKWRWLYEDDINDAFLRDETKNTELLRQEPLSEWRPDCRAEFSAE